MTCILFFSLLFSFLVFYQLIIYFYYSYLLCMDSSSAFVCVYHMYTWCLERSEDDIRSLKTGVVEACKATVWVVGSKARSSIKAASVYPYLYPQLHPCNVFLFGLCVSGCSAQHKMYTQYTMNQLRIASKQRPQVKCTQLKTLKPSLILLRIKVRGKLALMRMQNSQTLDKKQLSDNVHSPSLQQRIFLIVYHRKHSFTFNNCYTDKFFFQVNSICKLFFSR